jgi:hypothetical protein
MPDLAHASLGQIEFWVMQTIGNLLLAMIGRGLYLVLKSRGIQLSADRTARLEQIADIALTWAVQKVMDRIHARGLDDPDTLVTIIKAAADYATQHYTTSLQAAGAPVKAGQPDTTLAAISGLLERRYPAVVASQVAIRADVRQMRRTPA